MTTRTFQLGVFLFLIFSASIFADEKVFFQDNFDNGLSDKWKIKGLKKEDYRIRNGALEIRVQPGTATSKTPRIEFPFSFPTSQTMIASVELTVLDEFNNENEFAGMYLLGESGWEFRVKQEWIKNELVYSPGRLIFTGKSIADDKPENYYFEYDKVEADGGPLRIIVRGHYAHFQVGPSQTGAYKNYFFSAINKKANGFYLMAAGAKKGSEHWVRFDNFVIKPY